MYFVIFTFFQSVVSASSDPDTITVDCLDKKSLKIKSRQCGSKATKVIMNNNSKGMRMLNEFNVFQLYQLPLQAQLFKRSIIPTPRKYALAMAWH